MKQVNVISFGGLKGGVGKTTLNLNVAGALAKQGKKILVMDFDPQGSITQTLRESVSQTKDIQGTEKWLLDDVTKQELKKTIVKSFIENIDFIPSTPILEKQNRQLVLEVNREKRLITNLIKIGEEQELLSSYDHIIIDTNPSFDPIAENVYVACAFRGGVIQVVNADPFSLTGAIKNLKIWEKRYMSDTFSNIPNALKAILINKVKNNALSKEIVSSLSDDNFLFKDLVLNTIVVENSAIEKSILQKNTKTGIVKINLAIDDKRLNSWEKTKWIRENDKLNSLIKNGNPISNLILELQEKEILY
ncbi:ParA family protein [Mycoplasma yeatsii]|uniref:Chromosome partitioning protein n=1 Tax=Mycoplasma yeatsii TaxID=51365 RepID=A0ABU0NDW3_9MOLU|nr:ParA family protein [Mycoplasma yeatsii]MDQ0567608.1 chromosome partitioning protein [Mycoplasma yeatsii]